MHKENNDLSSDKSTNALDNGHSIHSAFSDTNMGKGHSDNGFSDIGHSDNTDTSYVEENTDTSYVADDKNNTDTSFDVAFSDDKNNPHENKPDSLDVNDDANNSEIKVSEINNDSPYGSEDILGLTFGSDGYPTEGDIFQEGQGNSSFMTDTETSNADTETNADTLTDTGTVTGVSFEKSLNSNTASPHGAYDGNNDKQVSFSDNNTDNKEHKQMPSTNGSGTGKQPSSGGRWGRIFLWAMVIGLAALLLSITFGGNSISKAALEVKGEGTVRIGDSYRYDATIVNYKGKLKDSLSVIWTVNGNEVKKSTAGDKNAFVFDYKPEAKGNYTIGVKIGNYSNLSQSKAITVKNPLITVTMDNKTMTYGQESPDFTYNISGMRGDDTAEGLNLVIKSALEKEMIGVGEYVIGGTASPIDGYDVEVVKGTLRVNPKCVSVEEKHLTKVYDGTADCPGCITAPLSGVLEGDEVALEGKVSFESAAVGKNKAVSFKNASLIGKDAGNYTIAGRTMTGTITAKTVTLSSLTAADKIFDGTTNVTFTSVGTLDGIIDGDEVAIGEIKAHFENASVGTKCRIIIDEIVLIGRDAKNYNVDVNMTVTADIKAIASVTGKRK